MTEENYYEAQIILTVKGYATNRATFLNETETFANSIDANPDLNLEWDDSEIRLIYASAPEKGN